MNIVKWCSLGALTLTFVCSVFGNDSSPERRDEDDWPVGVIARYDDHGAGIELDRALALPLDAIQIKTPFPEHQTDQVANEILTRTAASGKFMTSLQGGFTGESYKTIQAVAETVGLVPEATRTERMLQLRGFCEFAQKLHLKYVCFHFGVIPRHARDEVRLELVQTMRKACDIAAQYDLQIHLETGQEDAASLLAFIEEVDRDNLFINFDPANMILYGCGDPIEAVRILGNHIKSVHCKDAKGAQKKGLEWGTEVPFGQGDLNADLFFQTLRETGYRGALIVERENRNDPDRQLREAAQGAQLVQSLKEKYFKE